MTSFVKPHFSTSHPGVERAESALLAVKSAARNFDSARSLATFLLAAVVAALLVVANQVIEAVTDGHLLMAWIALWLVAFAAIGLLAAPASRASRSLREAYAAWRVASRAAAADRKLWEAALYDARIMAEINAAMTRQASGH